MLLRFFPCDIFILVISKFSDSLVMTEPFTLIHESLFTRPPCLCPLLKLIILGTQHYSHICSQRSGLPRHKYVCPLADSSKNVPPTPFRVKAIARSEREWDKNSMSTGQLLFDLLKSSLTAHRIYVALKFESPWIIDNLWQIFTIETILTFWYPVQCHFLLSRSVLSLFAEMIKWYRLQAE